MADSSSTPLNDDLNYQAIGFPSILDDTDVSGRISPVKVRSMKEYDQEIDSLQKENFNLKLRIYFLEENAKSFHNGDNENLYKVNISLKMEIETLKMALQEKQSLLMKAHSALENMPTNHVEDDIQGEVEMLRNEVEVLKLLLGDKNKELKESAEKFEIKSKKLQDLMENSSELSKENEKLKEDCSKLKEEAAEMLRSLKEGEKMVEFLKMQKRSEKKESDVDGAYRSNQQDLIDKLQEKEKLIEHLEYALKIKDVILEQVDNEKNDAVLKMMKSGVDNGGVLVDERKEDDVSDDDDDDDDGGSSGSWKYQDKSGLNYDQSGVFHNISHLQWKDVGVFDDMVGKSKPGEKEEIIRVMEENEELKNRMWLMEQEFQDWKRYDVQIREELEAEVARLKGKDEEEDLKVRLEILERMLEGEREERKKEDDKVSDYEKLLEDVEKEREKVICDKEDLTALMHVLEREVLDLKAKLNEVQEEKEEVVKDKEVIIKMMQQENEELIKVKEAFIETLQREKDKAIRENLEMLKEKEEMLKNMKDITEESLKDEDIYQNIEEEITPSNLHEYVQKLDLSLQHFDKVRNDLRTKKRGMLDAHSEGDLVYQWSGLVSELEMELCKEARDIKLFRQYIEKEKNVYSTEKDEMKRKFDEVLCDKEALIQKLRNDIFNLNEKLSEKKIDHQPEVNKEIATVQAELQIDTPKSLEKYSKMEECMQKLVAKLKKRDSQIEECNEVIKNLTAQLELNKDPKCTYNTSLIIQLSRELKKLKMKQAGEVTQESFQTSYPPIESTPANHRPSKVSSRHLMYEIGDLKEECKKRISVILGSTRLSVGDISTTSIKANFDSKDEMSLPSSFDAPLITQQLLDMLAESEARCALMKSRLQSLAYFLEQLINHPGIGDLIDVKDVSLKLNEASMLVEEMSVWLSDGKDIFNTTNTSRSSFMGRLSLIGGSISAHLGVISEDANQSHASFLPCNHPKSNDRLNQELQVCQEEKKVVVEELVLCQEEKKKILEKLDMCLKEKESVEMKLELYQREKESVEMELEKCQKEKDSVLEEIDICQREKISNMEETDKVMMEKDGKIREIENKLSEVLEELEEMNDKLKRMEKNEEDLNDEKKSLENQLRSMMEENYELKFRTEELHMKVVEFMNECDGEKIRLRGCVEEKELLMRQVEEMRDELEMIREDLRVEKEAMLMQLNEKQDVVEKLGQELVEIKLQCEEKEEEKLELQSQLKSLLSDLNKERFKSLVNEKENISDHHQSMRHVSSATTVSDLHSQSFDANIKKNDDQHLINKMESLQLQNDFLERKVAQLSTKSSHLMMRALSEEGEDHDHNKCHLQIEQMKKQIRELKGKRSNQPMHSKSQLREEIVNQINKTRQVLAQTAVNLDMAKIRQQVKQAHKK